VSDSLKTVIQAHQRKVQTLINLGIGELWKRYLEHDRSKLESPEYEIFNAHFDEFSRAEYGTAHYFEMLAKVSLAISHHYEVNRHHPEHFPDGIAGMDLIDLFEMLCDWMAATSYGTNGNLAKSIKVNTQRFNLSDQMVRVLENTAGWLKVEAAHHRPAPEETGDVTQEKTETPNG
jgi:hypothetical protein